MAVGTSHRVYMGRPHLNFGLLEELSREVPVPLVLHGGSNTGEDKLKKAVDPGIQKINLSMDLSTEYLKGVRRFEEKNAPLFDESGTLVYTGNRTVCANQALDKGTEAYQEIFESVCAKRYENPLQMLPECDIVSIHLSVTPETKGLINEMWFDAMRQDTYFINTSRAGPDGDVWIWSGGRKDHRGAHLPL